MGLSPEELNTYSGALLEEINFSQQRSLGMHLVEYADRHDLNRDELRELLRMIGL